MPIKTKTHNAIFNIKPPDKITNISKGIPKSAVNIRIPNKISSDIK